MKVGKQIRIASVCMAAVFLLIGCSSKSKSHEDGPMVAAVKIKAEKDPETVTAEEVVRAYMEQNHTNYRQKIVYKSELTIGTGEDALVVPSTLTIETERAGSYIYETQTMEVDHDALDINYADETYIVNNVDGYSLYSSLNGQDTWYRSETHDAKDARLFWLFAGNFKDASCSYSKKKRAYIVKQSLANQKESQDIFIDSLKSGVLEETDSSKEALEQALSDEDKSVIYTFSAKDMRLLSIVYDQIEYGYSLIDAHPETNIACKGKMTVTFSDYGKVKEDKVKVPDEIKNSAVASDQVAEA